MHGVIARLTASASFRNPKLPVDFLRSGKRPKRRLQLPYDITHRRQHRLTGGNAGKSYNDVPGERELDSLATLGIDKKLSARAKTRRRSRKAVRALGCAGVIRVTATAVRNEKAPPKRGCVLLFKAARRLSAPARGSGSAQPFTHCQLPRDS